MKTSCPPNAPQLPRKLSVKTPFFQSAKISLSVPIHSTTPLFSSERYREKLMPASISSASGPRVSTALPSSLTTRDLPSQPISARILGFSTSSTGFSPSSLRPFT